ncbi:MAG TPA: sensor histidine kinase [Actinocrinis sp.]|jgi:signal transduction histidine kinase
MQLGMITVRRVLLRPWTRQTWLDLRVTAVSAAVSVISLGLMSLPWAVYVPVSMTAVLTCAVASLALVLLAGPALTALRRSAFRAVLGAEIPKPPPAPPRPAVRPGTAWTAVNDQLRSPRTWRQTYYHAIVGPSLSLLGVLAGLAWIAALAALFYSVVELFTADPLLHWDRYEVPIVLLSVLVLYLAPGAISRVVRMDLKAATDLLGPSRAEQLARRVETLTESRAATVEAAEAERRRIERDLHDGAQQRLVSLAIGLGLARATMADDVPEPVRQALKEAHEQAREALAELRNLVRGLHPVVLEDRGLDAALSGIAARSPVPVRLSVDVPDRMSPSIEAVGYFIVSEALANVAKHANANQADVDVRHTGKTLRITVTDDGIGGADASRGTGLTGLAQRAASVDGDVRVTSPKGGPTTIRVEIPCAP